MKQDIHPEYVVATVHCSCGNTFTTRSTRSELRVEICSNCHPFYTGKQKLVDTGGRVERFQRRYAKQQAEQAAAVKEREASRKPVLSACPSSRPRPRPPRPTRTDTGHAMADEATTPAHFYGGQAVVEGVMMRGRDVWAVAVRRPAGDLHIESHDIDSVAKRHPILAKPFIRGVIALGQALAIGFRALSVSARESVPEEERLSSRQMGLSMAIAA